MDYRRAQSRSRRRSRCRLFHHPAPLSEPAPLPVPVPLPLEAPAPGAGCVPVPVLATDFRAVHRRPPSRQAFLMMDDLLGANLKFRSAFRPARVNRDHRGARCGDFLAGELPASTVDAASAWVRACAIQ